MIINSNIYIFLRINSSRFDSVYDHTRGKIFEKFVSAYPEGVRPQELFRNTCFGVNLKVIAGADLYEKTESFSVNAFPYVVFKVGAKEGKTMVVA